MLAEVVKNGHSQCRSFARIGARSEFVQQHQGVVIGDAHNGLNISYVGGECAEILLNRLLVADIREDAIE